MWECDDESSNCFPSKEMLFRSVTGGKSEETFHLRGESTTEYVPRVFFMMLYLIKFDLQPNKQGPFNSNGLDDTLCC